MTKVRCCFIPCDKPAEYDVIDGCGPDDHTQACVDHVGHLLRDGHFPASVMPCCSEKRTEGE